MTANKLLTVLIVSAVFTAAMIAGFAGAQSPAMPATTTAAEKVTMADIDKALATGPVFVEFETPECSYCKQQRPISEALAEEYAGNVTFLFVDSTENRDMAKAFQVSGVPQINVIARKSDGKYSYVRKDGTTSDNVAGSRFVGLTQAEMLKTALDAAVRLRG